MATFTSHITILIMILLLSSITFHITCMSSNHNLPRCNEKDREVLLNFRKGIIDRFDLLSNWTSTEEDCCAWKGVYCNNISGSGRVTKLNLTAQSLEGEINFAFLELEFLYYLDLSDNSFDLISSPPIRNNITHASNLYHLDLSSNFDLHMDDFHWVSQLSSLTYLSLTGIDLHKHTNWLHEVAMLPLLSDLHMRECNLRNFIANPSLNYVNFTSLVTLDLSWNYYFNSELPSGFFNFTRDISYLNLRGSNIHGEILSSLSNLRNLRYLYLSHNQFKGSIPDWIGELDQLQDLYLSNNMFSGSIPSSLGNLSSLVSLSIASNYFSGKISETTLSKFSHLNLLDMSNSSVVFGFDPQWVPPFQLTSLYLANTNQGPTFPLWIYTQKSLQDLDLSSSGISSCDVNKVMSFVEGISSTLYLSNNSIRGDISNVMFKAFVIKLDHNNFTGRLPHISPMGKVVDFSYNSFSGSIPPSWKNFQDFWTINLWSNRLSGNVFRNLLDMKNLRFMNLGKNEFSGTIPINISQNLELIILRGNQFEGNIPPQLFSLPNLFHMDLAHNKLNGSMPRRIYNMTQMVVSGQVNGYPDDTINLFTKAQDYVYKIDPQRRTIDLSANNLSGEVPLKLFQLIQVQTLNLSHNNFSGRIPNMIGGMINMESLDLSNNKFSGRIPQSLTLLHFLGYLNLSWNNLSGKIPTGTQLQSFNASSYIGNPGLCGDPFKMCFIEEEENPKNANSSSRNQDSDPFRESVYLGMGVGFAAGFWGICGSLFLIRKWRHAFFRFFDQVIHKLYVAFMVKLNSFGKTRPPAG